MSDIQSLAVDTAALPVLSENTSQPEIPAGENIVSAIRNAMKTLGLGKALGIAAFAIVVPGGLPMAAMASAALISRGRRAQVEAVMQ